MLAIQSLQKSRLVDNIVRVTQSAVQKLPVALRQSVEKVSAFVMHCSRSRFFYQGAGIVGGVSLAVYGIRHISQTIADEPEQRLVASVDARIEDLKGSLKNLNTLGIDLKELEARIGKLHTSRQRVEATITDKLDTAVGDILRDKELRSCASEKVENWAENIGSVRDQIQEALQGKLVVLEEQKLAKVAEFKDVLNDFKRHFDRDRKAFLSGLQTFQDKYVNQERGEFPLNINDLQPVQFMSELYEALNDALFYSDDSWKATLSKGLAPSDACWQDLEEVFQQSEHHVARAEQDANHLREQREVEGGAVRKFMKVANVIAGISLIVIGVGLTLYAVNPLIYKNIHVIVSPILQNIYSLV